jgi:hypothetical protein
MLNKIGSIFKSPAANSILNAGVNVLTNPKNKPFPPVALGGSIFIGILTTLFGGYRVIDCIRYQTERGQCDEVIRENIPTLAAGLGTITAGWGGFNTFNPKLHEKPGSSTPTPVLPAKELVLSEEETPPPHPEVIKNLYTEGNSQVQISKMLGISLYAVRKALKNGTGEGNKKSTPKNKTKK